jgi:plasmid stabilization system protein ParE
MLDVLPAARVEVETARVYLNEQVPGVGDSFVSEVEHAFDDIVDNPELHSFVETLPSQYGYRRVHLRKYHYIIVYRVVGDVACGLCSVPCEPSSELLAQSTLKSRVPR